MAETVAGGYYLDEYGRPRNAHGEALQPRTELKDEPIPDQPEVVTPLPDDFPEVGTLRKNGLLTVQDVGMEFDLESMPGMSKSKAERVMAAWRKLVEGGGDVV